jgi:hypothetical protein
MRYLQSFVLALLAIIAPIKPMLIAAFVLAGVDLVLGLMVSRKKGVLITSSGLKRTVAKIFLYELAILMSYIAGTYLLDKMFPVTKLVAGFIGAVELKSILENLDILNGSPLFTTIITKLASVQNDKLK